MATLRAFARLALIVGVTTSEMSAAAWAVVVRVETLLDGNKFNLTEVEVTTGSGLGLPNRVVPYPGLIPATLSDYLSIPENNAANTITVLGSPDTTAPLGPDRVNLLSDPHLNTGIFNQGGASPGLQVEFARPVVNGPGEDLLIFELTIGSGQTPDPLVVRQLAGVGTARTVLSSHYQLQGTIPGAATPNTFLATVENGGTTDLTELTSTPLINNGAVGNPKWHVVPIDLSTLGVADMATITAVEITSGDVTRAADLLLVMGLPATKPPGDYDGDYVVGGGDLIAWQRQLGSVAGGTADGNADTFVDAADLMIWRGHFGAAGSSTTGHAVPEPGGVSLAAALLFGACIRRQTR